MKKFSALVIGFILAVSICFFAGCEANDPTPSTTQPTDDTPVTVIEGLYKYTEVSGGYSIGLCKGMSFSKKLSLPSQFRGKEVVEIAEEGFKDATALFTLEIPNTVILIGAKAFSGCVNLYRVVLGESLAAIAPDAFSGCHKLLEIYNLSKLSLLPGSEGLGSVAANALNIYNNDDGQSKINYDNDFVFYTDEDTVFLIAYVGNDEKIVLPTSNQQYVIFDYAFSYCSMTSITLPDEIPYIGEGTFYSCKKLLGINIPDGVASIGAKVFYNCSALKQVTLPDSILTIGSAAFQNCIALENIELPDKLIIIEDNTFNGCTALSQVAFPSFLLVIDEKAFCNCTSLLDLELPECVIGIKREAFSYCSGLKSIIIYNNVTKIEYHVFYGCMNLAKIKYQGTMDEWSNIEINNRVDNIRAFNIVCTDGTIQRIPNMPQGDSQ